MKKINQIYINGAFVTPHGKEIFDLISPTSNEKIGEVRLGDEEDTKAAIEAAKEAFKTFPLTTKEERIAYLEAMYNAVNKREEELRDVMVLEYGGTYRFCANSAKSIVNYFAQAAETLKNFDLIKIAGYTKVRMQPVGVVGIITPWNSSNGFIASKLSTAIAAGCTAVIKPSEMSAMQTNLLTKCIHEAGLPKGVFNIVTGLGAVVGAEITRNPGISKISFTGSTVVGKSIAKSAVDTMKRVTLELGGKSPNIILDDANLEEAIPTAITGAYMNSG